MCRSQAEGGQRCATHTRQQMAAAETALAEARHAAHVAKERFDSSPVGMSEETLAAHRDHKDAEAAVRVAEQKVESARIAHASTPTGSQEFRDRADELEAKVEAALEGHPTGTPEIRRMIDEVSRLHTIIHRGLVQKAATEQVAARLTGQPAAPMPKAALRGMLPVGTEVTARNLRGGRGDETRRIIAVSDKQITWAREGVGAARGSTALTGMKCYRDGTSIYFHDDNGPMVVFTLRD